MRDEDRYEFPPSLPGESDAAYLRRILGNQARFMALPEDIHVFASEAEADQWQQQRKAEIDARLAAKRANAARAESKGERGK